MPVDHKQREYAQHGPRSAANVLCFGPCASCLTMIQAANPKLLTHLIRHSLRHLLDQSQEPCCLLNPTALRPPAWGRSIYLVGMIMRPWRRSSIYRGNEERVLPPLIAYFALPTCLQRLLEGAASDVYRCISLSSVRRKSHWIHREANAVGQALQYLYPKSYTCLSLPVALDLDPASSAFRPLTFPYSLDRRHPAAIVCMILSADEPPACSTLAALLVAQWLRLIGTKSPGNEARRWSELRASLLRDA